MKVPSFSYMGGKSRLRSRLIDCFPQSGNSYIEPFVGAGNVLFLAKSKLDYKNYLVNDKYSRFLSAVNNVNVWDLPEKIERDDFLKLKENSDSNLAIVLEGRVSFGGKGYSYGYNGDSGTHKGYRRAPFLEKIESAKVLLCGVAIYGGDWLKFLNVCDAKNGDFIYFDPPYYGTKASYPNINHEELIEKCRLLTAQGVKWALSGYDNVLYEEQLEYKRKLSFARNSEIKSSNKRQYQEVIETLWLNY